ncbi:hypothetical protein FQR65_LT05887 [Abscondita terminalis]|nr:hypothetical protein FQR65_LT05887 [Abscondita terminalis]
MLKYNLIAAVCQNGGIGKNNDLPWTLKKDTKYFNEITSITACEGKKNVVLMGRKTWESFPFHLKPFSNRFNFVLSRSNLNFEMYENVFVFHSWDDVYERLQDPKFQKLYDKIWILGGSDIYKVALGSKHFYRLYLTEINKDYDCDTFFPSFSNVKLVSDPLVPNGIQEENGVTYEFKVYENELFKG